LWSNILIEKAEKVQRGKLYFRVREILALRGGRSGRQRKVTYPEAVFIVMLVRAFFYINVLFVLCYIYNYCKMLRWLFPLNFDICKTHTFFGRKSTSKLEYLFEILMLLLLVLIWERWLVLLKEKKNCRIKLLNPF